MRIGLGTDTHRLIKGPPLILAGITIPHDFGLEGHSDADVVFHAVSDAYLGALALGDIGEMFPDTDPEHQGMDSSLILAAVWELVAAAGYVANNLDIVIEAQRPKLTPYKVAMRENLARVLRLDPSQVGLKAKTGEEVGPVGRGEAIHCTAIVLLGETL